MNVSYRCEHDFWKDSVLRSDVIDEPLAAVSGILMGIIPLLNSGGLPHPPLQFCIARASLVLCGLGTFVYHAFGEKQMSDFHLNGIIFDGVSMALVTVNVFLLHLNETMKQNLMIVSVAAMVYLFFWVVTNDLLTFNYLQSVTVVNGVALFSIACQYPLFVVVYVYILLRVRKSWRYHWPMWGSLFVSLVAWCLNEFACTRWTGFFIGHVIWHIGIAYVAHYLTVLGVAGTYGYQPWREGLFVKLVSLDEVVGCKKDEDCDVQDKQMERKVEIVLNTRRLFGV